MNALPPTPWIHIGECPVCVNGLCRLRTCVSEGQPHFYAMCDECEALWLEPSTDTCRRFPDAEQPQCPICGQPLYGPQAHWSEGPELEGTDWAANAIFDVPDQTTGNDDDLLA